MLFTAFSSMFVTQLPDFGVKNKEFPLVLKLTLASTSSSGYREETMFSHISLKPMPCQLRLYGKNFTN
jgi:hypothetical protein